MFKKILIPLDGSALAEKALPYATTLAQTFKAKLLVVRVLPPLIVVPEVKAGLASGAHLLHEMESKARSYLQDIEVGLLEAGIQTQIEYIEGGPVAEMILAQATDHEIDLIVMSTHGYSANNLWLYGSVANKVLQQAPCPIFLVKTGSNVAPPSDNLAN